ncbi:hypothetical protein ACLOJK_007355 [Asimina triloba]
MCHRQKPSTAKIVIIAWPGCPSCWIGPAHGLLAQLTSYPNKGLAWAYLMGLLATAAVTP